MCCGGFFPWAEQQWQYRKSSIHRQQYFDKTFFGEGKFLKAILWPPYLFNRRASLLTFKTNMQTTSCNLQWISKICFCVRCSITGSMELVQYCRTALECSIAISLAVGFNALNASIFCIQHVFLYLRVRMRFCLCILASAFPCQRPIFTVVQRKMEEGKSPFVMAMDRRAAEKCFRQLLTILCVLFPGLPELDHFVHHDLEALREACGRAREVLAGTWRENHLAEMHRFLTMFRLSFSDSELCFVEASKHSQVLASKNASGILELLQDFFAKKRPSHLSSFHGDLHAALRTLDQLQNETKKNPELSLFFLTVQGIISDLSCCVSIMLLQGNA